MAVAAARPRGSPQWFSVLVCAAPVFTYTANEGRGYGVVFLSAIVMVIAVDWAARRKRTSAVALFSVAALAGFSPHR